VLSAGGILLVAALARFLTANGSAHVLSTTDPVLGIPLRSALLLAGGLELLVALICLLARRVGFQIGSVIWLSANFVGYRLCLLYLHSPPQATAIGAVTDPLYLTRGIMGYVTTVMPYYLLVGSCAAAVWLWLQGRKALFLKMSCPSCGGHVKFAARSLGRKTTCPHCQATITLRRPENLKMSCFFCHGHIEFPAHALGDKLKCPHCKKDITLQEPAPA
jgi:hypothetical protein